MKIFLLFCVCHFRMGLSWVSSNFDRSVMYAYGYTPFAKIKLWSLDVFWSFDEILFNAFMQHMNKNRKESKKRRLPILKMVNFSEFN